MNQYPVWKNLLVILVLVIGGIFALPNLFGDNPAVQVSAGRYGKVDLALMSKVESSLKAQAIEYVSAELNDDRLLVRFSDSEDQLKAKDVINAAIDGDYIVALNLAPTTPDWLA